ncbi:uncharacterized protein DUF1516 [Scopulibacillus darangshiensis]|uniref:Uncharacterized protein DUF1516 n=1 Tax=Scopulibacillus darangshiensis TaxID=442528 RepID=A0A4R2P6D6_9BACL|nr:DUF1516 family protein [Scopulibacillus darangshiensis]TCP29788.1 uncharacterized protein DUF1516 [Scopulibacillus darangshiensis]
MVDAHVGFWTLLIIFFFISFGLAAAGKPKGKKVTHMIARLLYVLVFATGLYLVITYGVKYSYWGWPIIKMLFGLLILAMMEMILVKTKKSGTAMYWVFLIIGFIGVFWIGYGVIRIG